MLISLENTWSIGPHLTCMWAIVIKETQRDQAKTDQEHVRPTVDEIAQLTFFCVFTKYEFITTISYIYMWTVTKLWCVWQQWSWNFIDPFKAQIRLSLFWYTHTITHAGLPWWLPASFLKKMHHRDVFRHLLAIPRSAGASLAEVNQHNPFLLYFWESVWVPC